MADIGSGQLQADEDPMAVGTWTDDGLHPSDCERLPNPEYPSVKRGTLLSDPKNEDEASASLNTGSEGFNYRSPITQTSIVLHRAL